LDKVNYRGTRSA